jgi:hypothetical protein
MAAIIEGKHDLPALHIPLSMLWLLPNYERIQDVLTASLIDASARRFDRVFPLCIDHPTNSTRAYSSSPPKNGTQ